MSLPTSEAEGFVLAGGNSSRMGREKALVQLAGRPLIQHAIEIMRGAGLRPKIAGSRTDLSAFAETVPDEPAQQGLGPLAGICSALSVNKCRFAIFLPVDLPLIPPALIEYLVLHAASTDSGITVVSVGSFIQTFPVVVHRAARPALQGSLASGDRNCLKAFRSAALAAERPFSAVPIESLVQLGRVIHPRGIVPTQWFLNLNSPQDLALAEASFSASDPVK